MEVWEVKVFPTYPLMSREHSLEHLLKNIHDWELIVESSSPENFVKLGHYLSFFLIPLIRNLDSKLGAEWSEYISLRKIDVTLKESYALRQQFSICDSLVSLWLFSHFLNFIDRF